MSTTAHREWFKTAARHMHLIGTIHAELVALDEEWPEFEASMIRSGDFDIGPYFDSVERLETRYRSLKTRMRRHLALAPVIP